MLIPSHLDGVADTVAALYASLEESIVRDIVRRIVKTGGVSLTAQGQIHMAQQSGKVYDEVIADVARLMEATTQQVRTLFEDACIEAMAYDFSVYEAAGLSPLPLRLSPSAAQILGAGMRKTQGLLQNLTKTTALSAQRAYISACTLAEMQVESGAFDAVTAIRNAVREASKDGAFVQYPSGHRSRVDVAIRRAVLTGVNQTAGELSLHYADEMGCELVEVTAHGGARPEHAAWQGKVYSRSGKHPKYPPFKTSTGYGTGAGLCGWNCRHSFYPFFEGLSDRAYPRDKLREYEARTVEYNGKSIDYYDATQMQRAMERKIRDTRRTLAGYGEAMKAGGGRLRAAMQADFSQASVTLKKQEARLKDFLRQTGLRGDAARVQVNGFGRSISQRAVWANKRSIFFEDNTITLFDKQIRHLAHEEAIVYDKNGKFILKRIGSSNRVAFSSDELKLLKNAVLTHNHPSGGPLSDTDIYRLWQIGLAEVRAVTPHGVFCATQPSVWKQTPNKNAMRTKMFYYAQKYNEQIIRRVKNGTLNVQDADYLLQRIVMRKLTREYGVKMELIPWTQ